jgi:hypothetical protein
VPCKIEPYENQKRIDNQRRDEGEHEERSSEPGKLGAIWTKREKDQAEQFNAANAKGNQRGPAPPDHSPRPPAQIDDSGWRIHVQGA